MTTLQDYVIFIGLLWVMSYKSVTTFSCKFNDSPENRVRIDPSLKTTAFCRKGLIDGRDSFVLKAVINYVGLEYPHWSSVGVITNERCLAPRFSQPLSILSSYLLLPNVPCAAATAAPPGKCLCVGDDGQRYVILCNITASTEFNGHHVGVHFTHFPTKSDVYSETIEIPTIYKSCLSL